VNDIKWFQVVALLVHQVRIAAESLDRLAA